MSVGTSRDVSPDAELTHGEANGLVVPGGLCFLDRLHERPGVLVDLKHRPTD